MRFAPLLLLAACAADAGPDATCTDADGLADGAVSATFDGAAWESTATWLWQGDGAQVNVATADGWRLTLVAQTTADGETVLAAVEGGAFPVEVPLEEGGGGWALAYPDDGDSYSTDEAGGTLTVTALDGDVLAACFAFEAARAGGASVAVEAGALRALPFE